jgi:hypothetical protein
MQCARAAEPALMQCAAHSLVGKAAVVKHKFEAPGIPRIPKRCFEERAEGSINAAPCILQPSHNLMPERPRIKNVQAQLVGSYDRVHQYMEATLRRGYCRGQSSARRKQVTPQNERHMWILRPPEPGGLCQWRRRCIVVCAN